MLKEPKLEIELKHNTSFGDIEGILFIAKHLAMKISIRQLLVICSFENSLHINVKATIALLEYADLLELNKPDDSEEIIDYVVIPNTELKLISHYNITDFIYYIGERCFKKLIREKDFNIEAIDFDHITGEILIQNNAFPLHYAIFRNLFVSIGLLKQISSVKFSISSNFKKKIFPDIKKLTLEKLEERLQQEKERGEEAEQFVISFEKNRIPSKSSSILKISEFDVTAGYDIISYNNQESQTYDRFIEVKCFLGEPHFYWSINERSKARDLGDNYYIYLVDYKKIHAKNYSPLILKNPFHEITEKSEWLEEAEQWSVKKYLK